MANLDQNLKKRVMRRVYGIWFLRQIAPVATGIPLSVGFALWITAKQFFVARIIENFIISGHNGGISSIFGFVVTSLSHAPLLPMAIIGFCAGIFMILTYRLVRNFTQLSLVRI